MIVHGTWVHRCVFRFSQNSRASKPQNSVPIPKKTKKNNVPAMRPPTPMFWPDVDLKRLTNVRCPLLCSNAIGSFRGAA